MIWMKWSIDGSKLLTAFSIFGPPIAAGAQPIIAIGSGNCSGAGPGLRTIAAEARDNGPARSSFGTKLTCLSRPSMSASLIGRLGSSAFRLSTSSSVDVAHGLSLLFGLGTKGPSIMGFEDEVEQSFGRPCRQCDGRFKRTYELTSSIVPRGTSFHRGVELDFLLLHWILHSSQATATSLVHRNSVPSSHTRCMITANRRASATIAFFIPRCLATFIAQALSQDHFVERTNMLWAAS